VAFIGIRQVSLPLFFSLVVVVLVDVVEVVVLVVVMVVVVLVLAVKVVIVGKTCIILSKLNCSSI